MGGKWEEIPVRRVNHILALYFSTGYRDLSVLWLAKELACLYFVADILSLDLHCILLFY